MRGLLRRHGPRPWTPPGAGATIRRMHPILLRALGAASLAFLGACASTAPSALRPPGDADREAVLDVIQRSFDAIAAQGEEGARMWEELLLDRGTMTSVATQDGVPVPRTRTFTEHLERTAASTPQQSYLERMWDATVLVEGDIAVVWTPYDFWLGGEFSHGGIDAATLVRTEDEWKIASFSWSVVRDYESPLPPPE